MQPSPLNSSRRPLGILTNTPQNFSKPLSISASRTPQCFSRSRLDETTAQLSRPRAPSTPGGFSDLSADDESDRGISDDFDPASPDIFRSNAQKRSTFFVPVEDRYSVGGTALGGYDGFVMPAARAKPRDSITALVPATTRALMLEERLKELEQKNRSLEQANAQLRQQQTQTQTQLGVPAPRFAEAGAQAGGERHPCFGRLVASLPHKKSARAPSPPPRVYVPARAPCSRAPCSACLAPSPQSTSRRRAPS